MNTTKKMKAVTPTKKMSTIDLLNSKQEKITNAISKAFSEGAEVDGIAPHIFFEKKACETLRRVFKTDKDLRELTLQGDKKRKYDYPDFPVIVDGNGRKYAIDIKSSHSKFGFHNDIAPLSTYTQSRYNQFHGEWLVVIDYNSKKLNRSKYTPKYSVSLNRCVFGETHTFALGNSTKGLVGVGGKEVNVRPVSLRKYQNGKINFTNREDFKDAVENTIRRMSRIDSDFKNQHRAQVNRYIKRISK